MTDRTLEWINAIALKRIERGYTREEALRTLQSAGILDKDGNHTEPYKHLGAACKDISEEVTH